MRKESVAVVRNTTRQGSHGIKGSPGLTGHGTEHMPRVTCHGAALNSHGVFKACVCISVFTRVVWGLGIYTFFISGGDRMLHQLMGVKGSQEKLINTTTLLVKMA